MSNLPMSGPGKFEGQPRCHRAVYGVTLDGCADDSHSDDCGNWGDLIRGPLTNPEEFTDEPLSESEREYLGNAAGFIIIGSESGFVDVTRYDDAEELEADWVNFRESIGAAEAY